jgi:alpha-1,6-mannosyl-glycoprotein beta-1,2-N-acetylglucosaminyltransferase
LSSSLILCKLCQAVTCDDWHSYQAEVTPWISSKHNMGMAFNRSTWQDIRHCAEFFCTYDDYNWDWSLQHISQGCLDHKLYAMVMKGPRVFHIGEW